MLICVSDVLWPRLPSVRTGSYKLWNQYLGERRAAVEGKCITDPACQIVVNAHERALVRAGRGKAELGRGGGWNSDR